MLAIVPLPDDAAPVAPVAPAPLDRAALDRRAVQRKLLRNFETVRHMLVDWKGKSLIMRLGPNYKPNPENHVRYGEPRLVQFDGPDPREETLGAWRNLGGDGAHGESLYELVIYLSGGCDLKTATTFLKDLSDRLVELPK
jgi:hypothetical protein